MTADIADRSNWVERPEASLFSDVNLAAVLASLEGTSAVVFGWQYFYNGGSSRIEVAFTSSDQYLHHVERAKPGDHFTLFDLDALIHRAVVRLGHIYSTHRLELDNSTPMTVAGLDRSLHDVLVDEDAEVLVVRRFVEPITGTVDVRLSSLPGTGDERQADFQHDLRWGRGELVMFDQRVFDEDEHGGTVETLTPLEGRRVNALVDAKRPSLEGTVPLHGAY
jgi:hypothetical protein